MFEYCKLTDVSVIRNSDLPAKVRINDKEIYIPKRLKKHTKSNIIFEGQLTPSMRIHQGLGHLFNAAVNQHDPDILRSELSKSIDYINQEISRFIKQEVITIRKKGVMSFSQSHVGVPVDCLVITESTYKHLVDKDNLWENVSHVEVTRYPNLGPKTTTVLRLCVDKKPDQNQPNGLLSNNQILNDLKSFFELEEDKEKTVIGAFYIHPNVLKGHLEGDGDGDLVYVKRFKKGTPLFKKIDWRIPNGPLTDHMVEEMVSKFKSCQRTPISEYLPQYFDPVIIGPVTYMVRNNLHTKALNFPDSKQPLHEAWNGPDGCSKKAIEDVEFAMDMRKGQFTQEDITKFMERVQQSSYDIRQKKANEDWVALTLLSQKIEDVSGFLSKFPTIQSYYDYIQRIDRKVVEEESIELISTVEVISSDEKELVV